VPGDPPSHWLKHEQRQRGDDQVHDRGDNENPVPAAAVISDDACQRHDPDGNALRGIEKAGVRRGVFHAVGVGGDRGKETEDFAPGKENEPRQQDDGIVVLLGLQFVDLLLFMFAVQIAFAIPITLAIFWSRFTGTTFVFASTLALVIGLPIRLNAPEPWGSLTIFGVSLVVSVVVSLIQNEKFDFRTLRDRGRVTQDVAVKEAAKETVTEPILAPSAA